MAGQSENISRSELWGGNGSPFRISYGKQWMWMFLVSDALTFGGLLTLMVLQGTKLLPGQLVRKLLMLCHF